MNVVRPRVSLADLERAPEDGRRYELYDGEAFVVPAPIPRHQLVAQAIVEHFVAYTAVHGGVALISPIDIVFSDYDVVQPDVVLFRASRRDLVQLDAAIRARPDIAVEVLSPSTVSTDRGKKMQLFARYGVPEYWIVDPIGVGFEVHTLHKDAYSLRLTAGATEVVRSFLLPELNFPAAGVFPIPR
ncbi:MAG: Uma2 family endonuclease [Gemmatimonadales bacterium]